MCFAQTDQDEAVLSEVGKLVYKWKMDRVLSRPRQQLNVHYEADHRLRYVASQLDCEKK